jgi:RimJ/RimL family protein N-acetyltransferase
MNALAATLEGYGASVAPVATRQVNSLPYVAMFEFPDRAITRVFFNLKDEQAKSDIVITNLTTLPESARGNGFASQAIQLVLAWAKEQRLNEVRATQVGNEDARGFWTKNGFIRCPDPNPCGDYVYVTKN